MSWGLTRPGTWRRCDPRYRSMCRGKQSCTELESDPARWSTDAPLIPPVRFGTHLIIFSEAVQLAALGDAVGARIRLSSIDNDDLQTWYIEHGQQSGIFRNRHFGRPAPALMGSRDPIKRPDRFANEVFVRDGHRCRYCGFRLIPKEVLMAFSKVVGRNYFRPTGTNRERHGIV